MESWYEMVVELSIRGEIDSIFKARFTEFLEQMDYSGCGVVALLEDGFYAPVMTKAFERLVELKRTDLVKKMIWAEAAAVKKEVSFLCVDDVHRCLDIAVQNDDGDMFVMLARVIVDRLYSHCAYDYISRAMVQAARLGRARVLDRTINDSSFDLRYWIPSVLEEAVAHCHLFIVKKLIRKVIKLRIPVPWTKSLMRAAMAGKSRVVQYLLDCFVTPECPICCDVLDLACSNGHVRVMRTVSVFMSGRPSRRT